MSRANGGGKDNMSDGRPLRNLKGLLKLCEEGTRNEDAPSDAPQHKAMSAEKRAWLQEAMAEAAANDPVKLIKRALKTLHDDHDDINTDDIEIAFDTLLNYCEDIDLANVVDDLGGYSVFLMLIKNDALPNHIKHGVASVLAILAQNNPRWQDRLRNEDVVVWLLQNIEFKTVGEGTRTKALSALSAITRGCPEAVVLLLDHNGLKILASALHSSYEPLVTKAAFFVASLCSPAEGANVADHLVAEGIISTLLDALSKRKSNEQLARALLNTITYGPPAAKAKALEANAVTLLKEKINFLNKDDAFTDEVHYYQQILTLIRP